MTDKKDRFVEYRIWFEMNLVDYKEDWLRIPIDEPLTVSILLPQSMITGEGSKVVVSSAMDKLKKKLLEEMEEEDETDQCE